VSLLCSVSDGAERPEDDRPQGLTSVAFLKRTFSEGRGFLINVYVYISWKLAAIQTSPWKQVAEEVANTITGDFE
jgi:hypothetical protein